MNKFKLSPGNISLEELRALAKSHIEIELSGETDDLITASCQTVQNIINDGRTVYSINTGFGELARVKVGADELKILQRNIILSHAAGVGKYLADDIVRMVLLLKINALSQGYSGIRRKIIDFLIMMYNKEIYPCIPEKGSVGASGDLAPLAHMSLPILGYGKVRMNGKIIESSEMLEQIGMEPILLEPKEGLALLNGTQVSTAIALKALFGAEKCFEAAMLSGSLTIDAVKASTAPFRSEIHALRRQKGQIKTAEIYRAILKDSEIRESHRDDNCEKVQDPYSLRCQPQVMGACLDNIKYVSDVLEREANAVTDNPLIFADQNISLSGGNFHAEPVAMAADILALAISEIGAISERRIAMLIDSKISGLPPFLVKEAGVNSGFMMAHVTAAALASENKQQAYPACVDSLPTSANQEDHVSMATHAARRLLGMVENTQNIVAIELLAAAQGIEFQRPLKSSKILEKVMTKIREKVGPYEEDHYFSPDIREIYRLIKNDNFKEFIVVDELI